MKLIQNCLIIYFFFVSFFSDIIKSKNTSANKAYSNNNIPLINIKDSNNIEDQYLDLLQQNEVNKQSKEENLFDYLNSLYYDNNNSIKKIENIDNIDVTKIDEALDDNNLPDLEINNLNTKYSNNHNQRKYNIKNKKKSFPFNINSSNFNKKENMLFKFKSLNNTSNTNPSKSGDSDKTEFWFKIKSSAFLNKVMYPDNPENKNHFNFDKEGFLINSENKKIATDFFFVANNNGLFFTKSSSSFDIIEYFNLKDLDYIRIDSNDPIYTCIIIKQKGLVYNICENNEINNFSQVENSMDNSDRENNVKTDKQLSIFIFYCKLLKIKGESNVICSDNSSESLSYSTNSTTINNITIQPIILVPTATRECNNNWNYNESGEDWECTCKNGQNQSPINIPLADTVLSPTKPMFKFQKALKVIDIKASDGEVYDSRELKIKLVKNTFRIKANFGKIVKPDSSVYFCFELIIHSGSEHKLDHKNYAMEIQLICEGKSVNDLDKHVVMVFLFNKKPGVFNPFIDDIDFFNLPKQENEEVTINNDLFIPKIFKNLFELKQEYSVFNYNSGNEENEKLLPFSFYTYEGSLSFPPCSESATYYVVSDILDISGSIVELLNEAIREANLNSLKEKDSDGEFFIHDLHVQNQRAVQQINNREIKFYHKEKYCSKFELSIDNIMKMNNSDLKNRKNKGHYEKVMQRRTDYYFIKGNNPSNIPNSYVVSEEEASGKLNSLTDEDLKELKLD